MLNRIWFWLIVIGVLYAPGKTLVLMAIGQEPPAVVAEDGTPGEPVTIAALGEQVTESALDGANLAVGLCLDLIAIMVLWLGLMQVAKDAGLVDGIAWLLGPLMRWLFPEVPDGHPAQGAILMNMSANMLGLDNAATPMGLQAMRELQELNDDKETATNSMATFLAINTSSVTLVPFAVIGLRVAAGSENPAGPIFGMFLATLASTIVAVFAIRFLQRLPRYAIKPTATTPHPPEAV